jgi:hypothetical protein
MRRFSFYLGLCVQFGHLAMVAMVVNTVMITTVNAEYESDASRKRLQVSRRMSENGLESQLDAACGSAPLLSGASVAPHV